MLETKIDTIADTEILSGLDYEFELPCESQYSHGCTKIARWMRTCRFCGSVRAVCDANREFIISGGRQFRDKFRCAACQHTVMKPLHPWTFVPIKK